MSHLNYNHLYYFWMTQKKGSVTKAAEALFLTPQTVTGQIRQLEQRLGGKLFIRKGRSLQATDLGQLIFKYADRMFTLSYEMIDIVNYTKDSNILFEVGIADALYKGLASRVLMSVLPDDGSMHLCCFESTHEMLLEKLSQHKLDMILSDCAVDSSQNPGLFSKQIGLCGISFFCHKPLPKLPFPACLEERKLLMPSRKTSLGRKLINYIDQLGIEPEILGEFDDAALMKAFGEYNKGIFVAPSIDSDEITASGKVQVIGETHEVTEEYYVIFAERMIQHPAVKRLCETDFTTLFSGLASE
ncbi:transcriptional activator NhaR [Motilimonas pumila]|uniref:Transcriptional activator protein NhaR n=1 Tax=Motilimonas pumila TaxID=2303987 RepID=A0A418YAD6_9GAMM|nr:transcriptional activator NhaR [Motilimonas pumila]RJG39495.1 transcriptional activator NhaR [Motilimonas pumila]